MALNISGVPGVMLLKTILHLLYQDGVFLLSTKSCPSLLTLQCLGSLSHTELVSVLCNCGV